MLTSDPQLTAVPAPGAVHVLGLVPLAVGTALATVAEEFGSHVVREPIEGSQPDRLREADPLLLVVGPGHGDVGASALVGRLAADQRLQTVPLVVVAGDSDTDWFELGADEVLDLDHVAGGPRGVAARLRALLRRVRRDQEVHPSTRLPGSHAIRTAIRDRIARNEVFAACYADLDHFKEFNDRYGFAQGDAVIRAVAQLLVRHVEGTAGGAGFVGHIGGDDFLFLVPAALAGPTCEAIIRAADAELPARYSAPDRQAGYFFGKDRRGRLDRVPLMTLSIGVVTNERRRFSSPEQVSELATEMKSYAKTRPGSLWVADRRGDDALEQTMENSA